VIVPGLYHSRRTIPPPSSDLKSKPRKKPTEAGALLDFYFDPE
jgi:hypothetical protein